MRVPLTTLLWLSLSACGDDGPAHGADAAARDAGAPVEAGPPSDAHMPPDSGTASGDASVDVSFARDVAPAFDARCTYCHHPDSASGLDLTRPFDPAVGLKRASRHAGARSRLLVDPGSPSTSFLLDKIRASDLDPAEEGAPMPWHIERLDPAELADVRQWIADGAADDAFYRERIAPILGDGVSLPDEGGGKCSYCHYPGTSTPPDLTDPFDSVAAGDPDGSLLLRKVEGSLGAQMPFWPPAMTAAEVAAVERWIAAGAPDN